MLNLIISSKNRPMQLLALLDSITVNTRGLFNTQYVIYLATEEQYQKGYDIVAKLYPYVHFISQGDYKNDVIAALIPSEYTCFAVDDDIIYKELNKAYRDNMQEDVICFSLRLGQNINYCYPMDRPNILVPEYQYTGELLRWNWTEQELDFAYPLSVTGHIFRTEQIRDWSERIEFKNPNEHEAHLQRFLSDIILTYPKMVSYKESRMFGVPANRVNTTNNNRNGLKYPYTIEELNNRLLNGERIDVANMDYSDVNAAQHEIKYIFKR